MTTQDQSKVSTTESHGGVREALVRWTFAVLAVLVSTLFTWGSWTVGKAYADSGVSFTVVVTGSDKDGFDLTAENQDDKAYKCKATVTVTKNDGTQKTYDYSGTVRKKEKRSFGGEAGLKPAPITAKATSISCLPAPED